jgi:hypothetical protein
MAKDVEGNEKGSTFVIAISLLLALGAGGVVYYFHDAAAKAEETLDTAKTDYRKMADRMRKPIEEYLRTKKTRPDPKESGEDMMTFLDRKARESQIPPGSFIPTKNANSTVGSWNESSYTVTLQGGAKDNPVKKIPVVDFLRRVESERRSVKTKSLQLSYAGDDFKSVVITFSQFQPK